MYCKLFLVLILLFYLLTPASAKQHLIYPHTPTKKEQKLLYTILSTNNDLEAAFDPKYGYSKLKPGMKIVVANLDKDKEFILFSPPNDLCGTIGCSVEIWKNYGSEWREINILPSDVRSIIIYDKKTNGMRNIRFPWDKFQYYFNGNEYICDHCPLAEENARMLHPLPNNP